MLGRSAQCHLVINDASVSRRHAEITVLGGSAKFQDLDSRNGTFVDDVRLSTGTLAHGQLFRLGNVTFKVMFEMEEAKEAGSEEETYVSDEAIESLGVGQAELTGAQRRVFNLLLLGLDDHQIAEKLFVSPHTVHNHLRAIYHTFKVHSRAELLAKVLGRNRDFERPHS